MIRSQSWIATDPSKERHLTDNELVLVSFVERILWDLEVEGSGSLSSSTGCRIVVSAVSDRARKEERRTNVVVGSVTRTVPSSVISSLTCSTSISIAQGSEVRKSAPIGTHPR